WNDFRKLRVAKVVTETPTVVSIHLADPDGSPLPSVRAGQYLTIRITGAGEPDPVRSYSLSSAPDAATYRITVKREPQALASTYLNRKLTSGAPFEAAAPRRIFRLDRASKPVLLVYAGIGLTPVLSMLLQLADRHSKRQVWWINAAPRPQEHAMAG